MLFSLISLNSLYSLYSLLPGIVFDTCVCGGCASPVCWVSFSIPMSTSVALVIKAIASQFIFTARR